MTQFIPYPNWLHDLHWLKSGDCVYIVSDMLELAKTYHSHGIELNLNSIIDEFQRSVGKEGTLLFPTFNWDFCKGIAFDAHKTPVRTGALSKAALKRSDFTRTDHPLYSFAVWGSKQKELLQNKSIDSFGIGTIFEKLYDWNAKIFVIGLTPLQGVTYVHHVEQMVGVPYRYTKEFTADYTDLDGIRERRTYRMYVRNLDMDPQYVDGFRPLSEQMQKQGLVKTLFYEKVPNHLLYVSDVDTTVRKDILENDSQNMYTYHKIPQK